MGRRGRRRKEIVDDFKETTGQGRLKEEAPDRTVWRTRCRRGSESVVRQTTEQMTIVVEWITIYYNHFTHNKI